MTTHLANARQHVDGRSEVADVKDWQVQLDKSVVTSTSRTVLSACQTGSILLIRSLSISIIPPPASINAPCDHQGDRSLPSFGVHHRYAHTNLRQQLLPPISERCSQVSTAEIEYVYCKSDGVPFNADEMLTFVWGCPARRIACHFD